MPDGSARREHQGYSLAPPRGRFAKQASAPNNPSRSLVSISMRRAGEQRPGWIDSFDQLRTRQTAPAPAMHNFRTNLPQGQTEARMIALAIDANRFAAARGAFQDHRRRIHSHELVYKGLRLNSITQFVFHVLPLSSDNACSHRADVGVMCDQIKRVR
jgi:hypothetical protein